MLSKAVINTKLAKDVYKAIIKKYKEKLLDFDDKYSQTYATISINYKDGLCVYINGVENSNKIWLILKN